MAEQTGLIYTPSLVSVGGHGQAPAGWLYIGTSLTRDEQAALDLAYQQFRNAGYDHTTVSTIGRPPSYWLLVPEGESVEEFMAVCKEALG